jgi:hypothetical protein
MEKPTKSARVELRAEPGWLKLVDSWRRQQEDLPTRAEAIRRLADQRLQEQLAG